MASCGVDQTVSYVWALKVLTIEILHHSMCSSGNNIILYVLHNAYARNGYLGSFPPSPKSQDTRLVTCMPREATCKTQHILWYVCACG